MGDNKDNSRCRAIAQTIVAAIGSVGSEDAEGSVARLLADLKSVRASLQTLTRAREPRYDPIGDYRELPESLREEVEAVLLDALPGEGPLHDALHKARIVLIAVAIGSQQKGLDS